MANCAIGYPNYVDANTTYTPTFSGGSWSASLPLTNLADRRLAKVSRSSDAALISTLFDVDLKRTLGISLFAIPKHTMSLTATVRIRGSSVEGDFSSPVYDTGALSVFPDIYPTGTLPVGHPSYVTRKVSSEALADGYNIGFVHVASSPQSARYWRIEVDDTTNTAGYVDLGRLYLSGIWQPTINMSYGAKLGYETSSTRSESDGGAAIYNERSRRRNFQCVIEGLPTDEAMVSALDIQRDMGTTKQLFFVFDTADTSHMHRRAFLCVQRELSALDFPYYGRNTVPLGLVEEL
jgi:hypothetical protein